MSLTKDERDEIPSADYAWPDAPGGPKYPIDTQAHLDAAARLIGRAPAAEQAGIRSRAIAIAKRHGFTLPDSWQKPESDGKVDLGKPPLNWSPCPACLTDNDEDCGCIPCTGSDHDNCWCCQMIENAGKSHAQYDAFTLDFAMKSSQEVEVDGEVGLVLKGYASQFNKTDHDGEHQVPGSFADIAQTWGAEKEPMIMYQHGLDPVLTTRRIGRAIKYTVDSVGLYVEVFIPKGPDPVRFPTEKEQKYFSGIYQKILTGKIKGFSVGGVVLKMGKALLRWSMSELTITPTPCLDVAKFVVGGKARLAMKAVYGDLAPQLGGSMSDNPYGNSPSPALADNAGGHVPPHVFNKIMTHAQQHKDAGLHDHLLNKPTEIQGEHKAMDCSVCTARRNMMGVKVDNRELGNNDLTSMLTAQLNEGTAGGLWVCDVFPNYFVYTDKDSCWWKRTYSVGADNEVTIGEPIEVSRVTEYQEVKTAPQRGIDDVDPQPDQLREQRKADLIAAMQSNPAFLAQARQLVSRLEADRKVGRQHSKQTLAMVKSAVYGLKALHDHLTDAFGIVPDADSTGDMPDEHDAKKGA